MSSGTIELEFSGLLTLVRALEEYEQELRSIRVRLLNLQLGAANALVPSGREASRISSDIGQQAEQCRRLSAVLRLVLRIFAEQEAMMAAAAMRLGADHWIAPSGVIGREASGGLANPALWPEWDSAHEELLSGMSIAALVHVLIILETMLARSALAAFGQRFLSFHGRALGTTAKTIEQQPWLLLFPPALLGNYIGNQIVELIAVDIEQEQQKFWAALYQNFERELGSLDLDAVLLITSLAFQVMGASDRAVLSSYSQLNESERQRRRLDFASARKEHIRTMPGAYSAELSSADIQPKNLAELILGLGQIDYLGGSDEAVIRLLFNPEQPETLIVMLPSTQNWSLDSQVPNDLLGNVSALQGMSSLTGLAEQAVQEHFSAHPELEQDSVQLLLTGFSQGGIAAAAFASSYAEKYRIAQLVTVGSPIGRFEQIPQSTQVLALEADDDPVTKLDGTNNPNFLHWTSYSRAQGSGHPVNAHNVFQYADFAASLSEEQLAELGLEQFFGKQFQVTDYLGVRVEGQK
ncbi:MAG: hypothetical protein WBA28_01675 [Microbacteriaceae bacterium]